jgi:hypothetical protein
MSFDLDDLPPVQVFGEWDAPITDDAEPVDVPIGQLCMYCRTAFQPGDNGAIMPTGFAQHRECSLRSVRGGICHLVDHEFYCKSELGPDAGLSYRDSAFLVWWVHTQGGVVTRDQLTILHQLELLRNGPA